MAESAHDHDQDHRQLPPIVMEDHELTYFEKQLTAILNLLVEKKIITLDELRRTIEENNAATPAVGARIVAKAWTDGEFLAALRQNANAAIAGIGIRPDRLTEAKIVTPVNTESLHHVVVCTLCSCYPRLLLGQPPDWYKSEAYRRRVVLDPRGTLLEMGLELPASMEVRVVDSTAEVRYLVIPRRPAGAEGWGEAELARLVTKESMVGVAEALSPTAVLNG
ncbi:MAG: nitrile hydratase subunit alpha [Candidatus Tectomicrobia bacterium]|nr:nitrile hydratase subunit alpha [Candidatus Tectomicrobia bacterium]